MPEQLEPWEPRMSAERIAQIRQGLLAEASRHPSPRRRWRIGSAAMAATALLAVGGTAAAWVGVLSPDEPNTGYCSAQATLDREVWMHNGFGTADQPDGLPGTVDGLEVCELMWRSGMVANPDGRPVQMFAGLPMDGTSIPPLAACVVDGFLVVYPGDEHTCERLGAPTAAANR